MVHKAIDDHIEGQQPGLAALGTNPENKDDFCDASVHVTFYKKAAQFAKIQYYQNETKTKKVNDKLGEVGANKIANITPKHTREKLAIAEFLLLTSATKEIDGRQYSRNEFWEALAKTTVEMKETTRGDANQNGNGKERNVWIEKFAADIYNTVS